MMRLNILCWLAALLIILSASCKKEDSPAASNNAPAEIDLKIDPIKKKYIAADGSGHYSGTFSRSSDIHIFKFQVEQGKNYRIMVSQPDAETNSIELLLLNAEKDTLKVGKITYNSNVISFTATYSGTAYLKVNLRKYLNAPDRYYYLILENTDENYLINWGGKKWVVDGNWKVNAEGTITFNGEKTGMYRWIRLDSSMFEYSASFRCKTSIGKGLTKVGLAIDATNKTIEQNLPSKESMLIIDDIGNIKYLEAIPIGGYSGPDKGSITYITTNQNEWRTFGVQPNYSFGSGSKVWDIKCNDWVYGTHATIIEGYFYIVVEDNTTDELTFDSFMIK